MGCHKGPDHTPCPQFIVRGVLGRPEFIAPPEL